jgi:probable phosphoglycerate mutase
VIYLCRHGQTVFNAMRRYQGQVDSPLTVLGREQASAMGRTLAPLLRGQVSVWASPLGRAQESLGLILAEIGPHPVRVDERLMEVSMGAWDGLDGVEIEAGYPRARDGLLPGEWYFHGPGGESFEEFEARSAAVLAEIVSDPAPGKVIVAHGLVSRVMRGIWAGMPRGQMLTGATPQDGFFALEPGGVVRLISC